MGALATIYVVGSFSAESLAAFSYLIVVGSLFAFTAYVWLLRNTPISTVATYAYVNPVIAVLLGWAILSEEITATVLAGAVVIVVSVALVVRKEPASEAAPAGPGPGVSPADRSSATRARTHRRWWRRA